MSDDITRLLHSWRSGDQAALDELTPMLYAELRTLAASRMRRERSNHTLQPTALVNEVWMRLGNSQSLAWQDRAHFFGIAAKLMRQILTDHARAHRSAKRGGEIEKLSIDEGLGVAGGGAWEMEGLNDALNELEETEPRLAKAIELKYFAGLTLVELAEVTGLSTATVERDIRVAHAWLRRYLKNNSENN